MSDFNDAKIALVVHSPFENYQRGELISDDKTIEAILASDQAHCVNRIYVTPVADIFPASKATKKTKE